MEYQSDSLSGEITTQNEYNMSYDSTELECDVEDLDQTSSSDSEETYSEETSSSSDLDSEWETSDDSDSEGTSRSDSEVGENLNGIPLYSGARLSTIESCILILQYSLKHSLTKKGFEELLQLMIAHLLKDAKVQKSV